MQVSNNVQSPNFGMALKISKGGKEYLAQQSEKTLKALGELGEEIKDYKYWDLEIDDKGYRVAGKDMLSGAYRHIGSPERHMSDTVKVPVIADRFAVKGKMIDSYLMYSTPQEAEKAFIKMYSAPDQLKRTAAFLKELETLSAKKAYKKTLKTQAEQARLAEIDNLIDKFGVEA